MRRLFGNYYPPGCSGPPEYPCFCEVCGGDAEQNEGEVGSCICPQLYKVEEEDKVLGEMKHVPDRALAQMLDRFTTMAAELLRESKRRYALHPVLCSICKQEMKFEEVRQEECNCHGACREQEMEHSEKLGAPMNKTKITPAATAPVTVGLFNNDSTLFANARSSYKERHTFLCVVEGHIVAGIDGVVARFADDDSACAALTAAGYTRDEVVRNIVFHP